MNAWVFLLSLVIVYKVSLLLEQGTQFGDTVFTQTLCLLSDQWNKPFLQGNQGRCLAAVWETVVKG